MKKILGLDLGTNSIGWALIENDFNSKKGKILGMGSRIIPMSQDVLGDFGKGNSISQTAERTTYRSARRVRERHLLRRERLHRVLHLLGFLPESFSSQIDFKKRLGKFKPNLEPKLAYDTTGFIFKDSFREMLEDFKVHQPDFIKSNQGIDALVTYDWTIYYLRKKALNQKIEAQELAWIILNFNQKRGYYQLRGEEELENPNKKVEFHSLEILDVVPDQQKNKKGETWYSMHLSNGWIYRRASRTSLLDWKNKIRDFIVTTDLHPDGTEKLDKEGLVKRSFRAPSSEDWTLLKKKTEQDIDHSGKSVGQYIYENLLLDPKQKIKGKLVRTIERKYYKDELKKILVKQAEFHKEFQDQELYHACIRELYKTNQQHRNILSSKDLIHLILEDIIFYQRPLKSQKSTIANCSLEYRKKILTDSSEQVYPIKVIAKSNPYFQEFRLLQWLKNLELYTLVDDQRVTSELIPSLDVKTALFDFLNTRKEIKQEQLIEFLLKTKLDLKKVPKAEIQKYRWNYVTDKIYPCNETYFLIQNGLSKVEGIPENFLTHEIQMALWHIIYSVHDKVEFEKALLKFALKHNLNSKQFVEAFSKTPPFKNEYGSYSLKAIKKLLPLMRFGTQWNYELIDTESKQRIEKIITGEFDSKIKNRVREKAEHLENESDFQDLPLWLAQYIVYNRHSESSILGKWNSVEDLNDFLKDFKQHTLRNPIVEQIITETLRVVKDIWMHYGSGVKDYFTEIHVELGRDMKNPAQERERVSNRVTQNENTNLRIKALLSEMATDSKVANVRPYSPMQQEILKIYEEGVLNSDIEIEEEYLKISKQAQPTSSELKRYKLWLEQKYRSPYTGNIIPLNRLFTSEYEIEHVIPQSRYFNDSLGNKVICETEVNKLKDNLLGLEFIKKFHGYKVSDSIRIYSVDEYESFVKQHYGKNRTKRNNLLLEEIPEQMITRQLNDTRYISKYVTRLLSNLVRDDSPESKDDGVNSIHVLPGNGKVTTRLKQDWGLNDIWNDLILPRFIRMNKITDSSDFTTWNANHQKMLPTVPLEFSRGFSKKRIDHRHHALDALVIACATRDHINLLNNESARSESSRYDLNRKLRRIEKVSYINQQTGLLVEREVPKDFLKPWETFTKDAKDKLETIVVSFKQNLRIINKASNYYEKIIDSKKVKIKQEGINWAVRKSMHKETVYGQVNLPRVKVTKGKILTATRKALDTSFNEKTILSITDTGIQKILLNYLKFKGDSQTAFSPEGIEELNQTITLYNEGKFHQPILKVRVFEQGSKFRLGDTGNKKFKYVEAAKGTNLFFGIYQDSKGKRVFETIPLNIVIEREKQGLPSVPEVDAKGNKLLLCLSPNDLIHVPDEDTLDVLVPKLFKVVSFTGSRLYVIPHYVATTIVNKNEFSQLNKIELTKEKQSLSKVISNRLGELIDF